MTEKKKKYQLKKDKQELSDKDILKYKDYGKLVYNYQQATRPLYKKPLYKNPKTFMILLIIMLLAYILSTLPKKTEEITPDRMQQEQIDGT